MKANTEKTELALQQASNEVSAFVVDLREEVEAIESQYADIVPVATTKDGYKYCKSVRADLMPIKSGIDKQRKALKQPIIDAGKLIDSSLNPLIERVESVMRPFISAYQEVDNEIKRKEEARKQQIETQFGKLHALAYDAMGQTSTVIETLIEELSEFDFNPDVFQERTNEAVSLQAELMEKLTQMLTSAIASEEQAKQAQEQQRIADEQAKRLAELEAREKAMLEREQRIIEQQEQHAKASAIEPDTGLSERLNAQAETMESWKRDPFKRCSDNNQVVTPVSNETSAEDLKCLLDDAYAALIEAENKWLDYSNKCLDTNKKQWAYNVSQTIRLATIKEAV